ncbi:MBL fold metallo-hydrolase [Bradyrhizobium sp. WYCCWR 13023]|uniref:MBL fold metallo-hydrolase n=1 Tax=Bradyrhizobium zhengyangense TaxID=2911009 RepID=A0A9X1RJZ2_9BRAD|nr:MBL fold metallo-hydrolase [Bradyrhizobium zhengyangense]MCG2632778.1 MBL fold metallo-hydrolase [Bradyrhizobium zhengyangense]
MPKFIGMIAGVALGLVSTALFGQNAALTDPPAVAAHLAEAREFAGDLYLPVQQHLCYIHSPEDEARVADRKARNRLGPTPVFDNFYYVGTQEVSAWALTTSDGIILFDSLNNPDEAKAYIVQGLRDLGLNPGQVKYVVITHGHGDHFGGAQYIRDTFGARLVASAVDWDVMANGINRFPPQWRDVVPQRDMVLADGQTLTLGDASITFHITPGHTQGTLSSIFRVQDHGKSHVVAFGVALGFPPTPNRCGNTFNPTRISVGLPTLRAPRWVSPTILTPT